MAVVKISWAAAYHDLIGIAPAVSIHRRPLCGNICNIITRQTVLSIRRNHRMSRAWATSHLTDESLSLTQRNNRKFLKVIQTNYVSSSCESSVTQGDVV